VLNRERDVWGTSAKEAGQRRPASPGRALLASVGTLAALAARITRFFRIVGERSRASVLLTRRSIRLLLLATGPGVTFLGPRTALVRLLTPFTASLTRLLRIIREVSRSAPLSGICHVNVLV